jgi:hypothetical protein
VFIASPVNVIVFKLTKGVPVLSTLNMKDVTGQISCNMHMKLRVAFNNIESSFNNMKVMKHCKYETLPFQYIENAIFKAI